MKKSDSPYIAQILESVATIRKYVGEQSYEEFLADGKTQDAVLMQLQQIGETAKRVSTKTKTEINVPWKKISGFRDVIAHEYYDILLSLVWNNIISELHAIEAPLAKYLKAHPLPEIEEASS